MEKVVISKNEYLWLNKQSKAYQILVPDLVILCYNKRNSRK